MSDATPGAMVLARREALGLTRQDVADSLNLNVRVVEAIEAEAWQQLPGPAFVRGYLRAYAKLLEIDGESLTSAFDACGGARVEGPRLAGPGELRKRGVTDLLQKHPGAVLGGAVVLVICAVGVVLMAVWPRQPPSELAATTSGIGDLAITRPPTLAATSTIEPAAAHGPAVARSPADAVPTAAEQTPVRATSRPGPPKDPVGARRITPTGTDRLSFAFTDDCWVEVKDARGGSLFSELGKAGATLELIGSAPFHIVLGNAPAVTLQFNAERVVLAPHTRNRIGTLVLGQ